LRPSVQARFFSGVIRALIRRRDWGEEQQLARRARKLFGAPPVYRSAHAIGLNVEQIAGDGVRGEWISVSNPEPGVVFYVHGGGFVACSSRTHRPITAALARLTKRRVLSVDYRLAPENRYPAAMDDVMSAYDWLRQQGVDPRSIALAGDSAGGNLVLSLVIRLRHRGAQLPACAVTFSPWTDLTGGTGSGTSNDGRCAMFRPENFGQFARAYLGRDADKSGDASPMFADVTGLPPVLFHVGATELLLDDSRIMHERVRAAGGETELEVFEDVPHGWQMLTPFLPEARESLEQASAFIRKKLQISLK
jgi:acetyl esterase/lipase